MTTEIDIAFALLRVAIAGVDKDSPLTSHLSSLTSKDWWSLFRLLQQNHVVALTADTMATLDVPREVKIPWLAERDKAVRWHRYQLEVQQEIVSLMEQHGIKTLVLKGTHLSQYYPQPELREFGDLDFYFYDQHDEADRVAREVLKVEVSNDAHHHSKYNYHGVTVESHYDFLNAHTPRSNRRYEALLKKLEKVTVTCPVKANEDGRLFGSVGAPEILAALAEKGIEMDKKQLVIYEPFKALGDHEVTLHLHPEVHGHLKVKVVAEKKAEPKAEKAKAEPKAKAPKAKAAKAEEPKPEA